MTKKFFTSLMIIALLITGTFFTIISYSFISNATNTSIENRMEHVEDHIGYSIDMDTAVYVMKYFTSENNETPYNVLIEENDNASQEVMDYFDETIFSRWNSILNSDPNVHFYALNNETNLTYGNVDGDEFENQSYLNENYHYYVKIEFTNDGDYNITASSGNDDFAWRFTQSIRENISEDITYEIIDYFNINSEDDNEFITDESMINESANFNDRLELKQIENMTYIFAVPLELVESGNVYVNTMGFQNYVFSNFALIYLLLISAGILFLALFIPVRVVKEWRWYQALMSIKFEILVLMISIALVFLGSINIHIAYTTIYFGLESFIGQLGIDEGAGIIEVLINLGMWLTYYCLILATALLIRFIFHKGLSKYIINNTLLFALIKPVRQLIKVVWFEFKKILNATRKTLAFDLSDKTQRFLIIAVIVNAIVVSILISSFRFDAVMVILYSLCLYAFVSRSLNRVKTDYSALLDVITKLSNTDFNVVINRDLGAFESVRKKLQDLKIGFENAVNEEIKSQKMKTELTTNISHDLKTPLTSIISYVDLLKDEEDEAKRQEYINIISRNSQRLKNLINDLFEISKINSGNVNVDLIEVELVSLMKQVLSECQNTIDSSGLVIKLNVSEEKIVHQLDSLKTYRMFENLVVNICKYAMKNTRVFIDVVDDIDKIIITMKNISASEINLNDVEITDRFVRGDKSRNTEGSGLGLAIVKSFAEIQNGSFKVSVDGDLFKATIEFKK